MGETLVGKQLSGAYRCTFHVLVRARETRVGAGAEGVSSWVVVAATRETIQHDLSDLAPLT